MTPASRRNQPSRIVAALLGLAIVVGGCSTGGSDSTAPTSAAPTTSTTAAVDVEAEVITAYLAAWAAYDEAGLRDVPNPDHPALTEHMTGEFLATVRASFTEMAEAGIGARRGEATTAFSPRVTRLSGNTAVVEDCWVDGDVEYDIESGTVTNDDVVVARGTFRLVREDGAWKVESSAIETSQVACEEDAA